MNSETTTMTSSPVSVPGRKAPWIGIGVSGAWTDYREALKAAELDFTVHQEKVYWNKPIVPIAEIPGYPMGGLITQTPEELPLLVNVRDSDNKALGTVTHQYGVVQNEEAFKLLQPFCDAGGVITQAGMTEQGLNFMVLRMMRKSFLGDQFDFDVMCCNSFNCAFPLSLMIVPTRIICQNMYRKFMHGGSDAVLHMRHGNKIDERIEAAGKAVASLSDFADRFGKLFVDSAEKDLSGYALDEAIAGLFPYPKPGGKYEAMSIMRVDEARKEFREKYYNAYDNIRYKDTVLGLLNAYYDWLSHRAPGKMMPGSWEERRLSGLVSGNDVKTKVIKEVMR